MLVHGAQYRRDEPSLAGNAIRQEQEVLIPCLHQLLESGLTYWTDRMNMSFLTEFYKHVGAEFCLSYFSLNLYIRGIIFDLVSKIFEYICLHKQVQTFAWLSPSGCEAVQAGSCAVMFYTLRQLNSESAMQIKGDFQLPAARIWWDLHEAEAAYGCLCPYVERCQM